MLLLKEKETLSSNGEIVTGGDVYSISMVNAERKGWQKKDPNLRNVAWLLELLRLFSEWEEGLHSQPYQNPSQKVVTQTQRQNA